MRALPSLAFAAILACAALPARADYMIGFEAFRIEEYGVAHSELLPAAEAGDLHVILKVVLPAADTARAKELYEQMSRDLAFDPRAEMGS